MQDLAPRLETRNRIGAAVGLSILLPGAGHLMARRTAWAAIWFGICQLTLFLGFALAGNTQLDYGTWFSLGGTKIIFLVVPEMANFLGTQVAALAFHSVESGGQYPEALPWRTLGYLLSGASGVLACIGAAHAAGAVLAEDEPTAGRRVQPGGAAVWALMVPGAGHWVTGRRFKAALFAAVVLGMFLFGMALGGFADFDRQRHPYYWAGQMYVGPVGWVVALAVDGFRFRDILPYQDGGLLFTTSAGLFNVVAALDAYHRAQFDWLKGAASDAPETVADAGSAEAPRSDQDDKHLGTASTPGRV